jgi:hypothetical protein
LERKLAEQLEIKHNNPLQKVVDRVGETIIPKN